MTDTPLPAMSDRRIWLAVSGMFIQNGALFGIWAARIPSFKDRFSLDSQTLGLLLLLMAAGAISAFPVAGRSADHFGAARVTRGLAAFKVLALVALAFAPTVTTLGIALFLFGVCHGGMDVAMNAWAAEVERQTRRPYMPSFHAMWSVGAGLGALSGTAAVLMGVSPQVHFPIAAVLVTAFMLAVAAIPWTSVTRKSQGGPVFRLPHGALLLVGALTFCSTLGEGAMADWSAIYLRDITRASESIAAAGYAAFSAAMVSVRLSGALIAIRFGPVRAMRISGASALTGIVLIVGIATPMSTFVGLVLLGLGYGLAVPLAFSRAANEPGVPQAQAIASVATLSYGGMLLGPPIIGFIADASSLRVSFAVLGGLAILTLILASALRPTELRASDG